MGEGLGWMEEEDRWWVVGVGVGRLGARGLGLGLGEGFFREWEDEFE